MDIKKHIEQNRDEFDRIEQAPTDAIWIGIQYKLERKKRKKRLSIIAMAASLLLIFTMTFLFNQNTSSKIANTIADDSDFSLQEQKYFQMAADKKDGLEYQNLDPEIYGEIFSELHLLDSMYLDLKEDLTNSPDTERAIETAIRFHERRLHILELLEKEIENQKRIEEHENTVKI